MAGDYTCSYRGCCAKVGPTSEIEFKVQFERSGAAAVVGKILTFLGAGQACGARPRCGESREGPLDVGAVAKFQTF